MWRVLGSIGKANRTPTEKAWINTFAEDVPGLNEGTHTVAPVLLTEFMAVVASNLGWCQCGGCKSVKPRPGGCVS